MFLLGFLDRRREIAVLKAVGFGGTDIAAVFGLEVVYTGLAGLAVGCLMSYGLLSGWLGRALPGAMVVRAAVVTLVVLGLAALLPIAMAGAATVTELLVGRKVIAVFRQRVSTR
jgi:ABC-type antimicrobial peptide transport system permease subunit